MGDMASGGATTATDSSTRTEIGNSITGAYTTTTVASGASAGTSYYANETDYVSETYSATNNSTTSESGNHITQDSGSF